MVRDIKGGEDFCGKLHGSPVTFGTHDNGDTRWGLVGGHASQNSCGYANITERGSVGQKGSENTMNIEQGKRLRG
ncbi:hypothetical protein BADSM9389_31110 [Buttiauxella agrestis]|nr:hypothetical protein BADSM9389_31110 [Buttiauxella agrestis]